MDWSVELANRIATRIKGTQYQIDNRIPANYLRSILAERAATRIRGAVRFARFSSSVFVARGARFRAKNLIVAGNGVTFGPSTFVDAASTDGVRLGNNVSLGRNTRIECTGNLQHLGKGIIVGDNVGLGTDSFYGCAGGITIGADTIIGNYVSFHSENHNMSRLDVPIRSQGVSHQGISVGRGCWIGAKATILDGAHIGNDCVIAAGAVVTAGIYADRGVYAGVPARLIHFRS